MKIKIGSLFYVKGYFREGLDVWVIAEITRKEDELFHWKPIKYHKDFKLIYGLGDTYNWYESTFKKNGAIFLKKKDIDNIDEFLFRELI